MEKNIEVECESFQDKLLFILCNAHKLEEKPKQFEGKLFVNKIALNSSTLE